MDSEHELLPVLQKQKKAIWFLDAHLSKNSF